MKRRDFLRNTGKGIVIPTLIGKFGIRAFGSTRMANALDMITDTDKVLVMVFMNGGNDGLNTVVPLDQLSALNTVRPHVILPESSLIQLDGTNVGLHPSLTGFKQLYDEDRLSIVQNVGYPNPNYSHFRSTDIWMSGSDSNQLVNNGWTGRYLNYEYQNFPVGYPNETMPDPLAVEIGYTNSLLFMGPTANMGMVINDPTSFYNLVDNIEDDAPDTNAGERLTYVRLIARQSQLYGEVVKNAAENVSSQGEYPEGNYLAEQLKIVARLIAGGLKTRLYMVQIGGFDTHDAQVESGDHTEGYHSYLLEQTSSAIKAFMDDATGLGIDERILGMTFSEFGRRVVSNSSGGTDHGTTAPMFFFGNHVNSTVIGENPEVSPNMTYEDNLDMEFDFRQVYSTVFREWFCVPEDDIGGLLFNDFSLIPFLRNAPCSETSSVHDDNLFAGQNLIEISPNPVNGQANITFESFGGESYIQVYDLSGKLIQNITKGEFLEGTHAIKWDSSELLPGQYFVRLVNKWTQQTRKVVKI